ncbi:MAG: hypothetical protein LRY62_02045 [Alphaproteobacteria bacterium]|nr:hypothetical protein [Alphaproteobacteria bacterium]
MKQKTKILWGVCGIGHGHTFRQKPLIEHFSKEAEIVILAYGESYDVFTKYFDKHKNVSIERVAVPFYVGNQYGLDFEATAIHPANQNINFRKINAAALDAAIQRLGKPDLVISDYEPISAQYAYLHDAPLVTIDQQSKYLTGHFPQPLNGQWFNDEIERLRMFFPKAEKRLASTFFKVVQKTDTSENVDLCPPVLSDEIISLQRKSAQGNKSIVVYISSQQPFGQSVDAIIEACRTQPDYQFHIFGKGLNIETPPENILNIHFYDQGDPAFHEQLSVCDGIVSTAGHTLLSEAMYLGIPVYAIPLPVYEQQMNAHIIHENGFGVSHLHFDKDILASFIKNVPRYAANIKADKNVLLRTDGRDHIIEQLNAQLS